MRHWSSSMTPSVTLALLPSAAAQTSREGLALHSRRLSRSARVPTTRLSHSHFAPTTPRVLGHSRPARVASHAKSTTSTSALAASCGMAPPRSAALAPSLATLSIPAALNCAPTSSGPMAVLSPQPRTPSTNAPDVETLITELTNALLRRRQRALTSLKPEGWRDALDATGLTQKYPDIVHSIIHGFDAGIPPILSTFAPPNRINTAEHQNAFKAVIAKELAKGRYLGPYPQRVVEAVIGPFQTSPISMTPKPNKPSKFRLVQNLSYPHTPYSPSPGLTVSSINSSIDSTLYPCYYGTFSNTCRLIWTIPPSSQGAVLDLSEAYRSIPLPPDQWAGAVVRCSEQDEFAVDTCAMFGLASAGGVFGHVADAGVEVFRGKGIGPISKWVDDHIFIRVHLTYLAQVNALRETLRQRVITHGGRQHVRGRLFFRGDSLPSGRPEEFDDDFTQPLVDLSQASPRSMEDAQYSYAMCDIDEVSDALGYVWERSKDIPFCNIPVYFGFAWDIGRRTVAVPVSKREKYLLAIREWEAVSQHCKQEAVSLYGKLMHVALVIPQGRSYLAEFEHFLASFHHSHPLARRHPPKHLPSDLNWWKRRLLSPISAPIPGPAELVDIDAFSDASSGYGIGVYIRGHWRAYRLLPGWRGDHERDIGWAEAVGFYLLALIVRNQCQRGQHYKIYGDNEGVVSGWWNGRSHNRPTNLVFRRIHEIVEEGGFYLHTRYIPSKHNPADAPSRGIYGPTSLLLPRIVIPLQLQPYIVDFDAPYTASEQRSRRPDVNTPSPTGNSGKHQPRTDHWQRELEREADEFTLFATTW